MGRHRKGVHTLGGDVSTSTDYVGRHVDTLRQPSANTTRARVVESLDDSAHGDVADEVDRGGRYDKR